MLWLLLLVIIIVAIVVKIKRNTRTFYIRSSGFEEQTQAHRPDNPYQQSTNANSEKMIRCPTCGVYIPISEAIHRDGQYYCCQEHAQK